MARAARDSQPAQPGKQPPLVVSEKLRGRLQQTGDQSKPIRTVLYLEVGDMPPKEVAGALYKSNVMHGKSGHPTFTIPLRNGKAMTDVLFEQEVLDMIRAICEVRDGQICFKRAHGEPVEVDTMRVQI